MKMKKFAIISLGCSRNLVDSEVIAGALKERGLKVAALMLAFIFPFAFLVGGVLNAILRHVRLL